MKTGEAAAVIEPELLTGEIAESIHEAFRRAADTDARHVRVEVNGGHVTLSGNVESWKERQAAERAALATPGVAAVTNRIEVGLTFYV